MKRRLSISAARFKLSPLKATGENVVVELYHSEPASMLRGISLCRSEVCSSGGGPSQIGGRTCGTVSSDASNHPPDCNGCKVIAKAQGGGLATHHDPPLTARRKPADARAGATDERGSVTFRAGAWMGNSLAKGLLSGLGPSQRVVTGTVGAGCGRRNRPMAQRSAATS